MIDSDWSYWNALHNGWPAFYVIGRDKLIHGRAVGEMHSGRYGARELDALIDQLLAQR
jgi:hypothetical protein